jgi:predicted N-acetyltransferase YhbS
MAIRYCKTLTPGQIRAMHRLYNQSFQRIRTSESCFRARLGLEGEVNAVLEERQGALLGYGLIEKNCLKVLAVAPEESGRGLGSALLRAAEEQICRRMPQADRVLLGSGAGGYLMPGVPMKPENDASAWFARRGYAPSWISMDMIIDLETMPSIQMPQGVELRWRCEQNPEEVLRSAECAESVEKGWGDFYKKPGQRVLLAMEGRQIVGVNLVDQTLGVLYGESLPQAAGFGCLAVAEDHRDRGIGRALCLAAMEALKALGAEQCFIGYTYLENWYGKMGARKYMGYWMGEKRLI